MISLKYKQNKFGNKKWIRGEMIRLQKEYKWEGLDGIFCFEDPQTLNRSKKKDLKYILSVLRRLAENGNPFDRFDRAMKFMGYSMVELTPEELERRVKDND